MKPAICEAILEEQQILNCKRGREIPGKNRCRDSIPVRDLLKDTPIPQRIGFLLFSSPFFPRDPLRVHPLKVLKVLIS